MTHCTDVGAAQPTRSSTTSDLSTPVSHHPDQSNPLSRMILRSAILGKRLVLGSSSPVNGLVLFPSANHFSISVRSYVCPSTVITGSLITSIVNGHWKESKTKEATAPAAADSARDTLSAGAAAGASSGAAADPRAAVEAAVSAAPGAGACSTSACRSGTPPAVHSLN